jgi:hypothetical protein
MVALRDKCIAEREAEAARAQRQDEVIVSGRECVVEGCSGREYLELDHCEVDHAKGGPTVKWNLAFACSIHHKLKTAGWILGPPDPITGKRRLDPPRRIGARHERRARVGSPVVTTRG